MTRAPNSAARPRAPRKPRARPAARPAPAPVAAAAPVWPQARSWVRRVLSGAVAAATLWAVGFAWYLHAALADAAPPPPRCDGIVALTGGAGRVEAALKLLAEGQARLLLVSGVGGSAALAELARAAGVDPKLVDPRRGGVFGGRITLGRAAQSTRGNAAETAAWARGNGIHSLIVVTAGYHMPRALAEIGRALPDVQLYRLPVQPAALRDVGDTALLRLLAGEYTKYLAAASGLTALMPERHG